MQGGASDIRKIIPVFLIIILACSCTSYVDLSSTDAHLRRGEYTKAYDSLERSLGRLVAAQGPLIASYDLGMLARLAGDWRRSNELLSDAERRIQEAYTKSITASIASFIVNDNTKEYGGESYEDIYLNLFKALNYLHLGQYESSLVEIRRMIEKQSVLQERYEREASQVRRYASTNHIRQADLPAEATSFTTSALANYLGVVIARHLDERSTLDYSFNQIHRAFETQAKLYPFPVPESVERLTGEDRDPVHLIAFSGRFPVKEERMDFIRVSPSTYTRIAYPVLQPVPSAVASVRVRVDREVATTLERMESFSLVAEDAFRSKSGLIYAKASMRAVSKELGLGIWDTISKDKDGKRGAFAEFLSIVFRVGKELSESADLRSTHYLPAEAWVGTLDLEPGSYTIEVEYLDRTGRVLHTERFMKTIDSGTINLLESYSPL
ncbi:MAG: hypothetical protein GX911_05705 [Spirochaetales bacterium]|nr:hypothetical protein [Spirochaetales bacterium]